MSENIIGLRKIWGITIAALLLLLVVDLWSISHISEVNNITVKDKWIEYGGKSYGAGDEWNVAMAYGQSMSAPEPKFLFMDTNGKLYEIAFQATLAHYKVDPIGVFQRISPGKTYKVTIQGWGWIQKEVISVAED